MSTQVYGLDPWDELSRVSRLKGPRYAAIAFIGTDAPKMLGLDEGDVLVCNASQDAVEAGATDPGALEEFVDRGVLVYTCSSLHAKVLAVENRAAVGSANASRSSARSLEAAVVSNDPKIIRQVRGLVEEAIGQGVEANEDYLKTARKWAADAKRDVPKIPGVTSSPPSDDVFTPKPGGHYWVAVEQTTSYEDDENRLAKSMKESAKARRLRTGYKLDTYLVPEETSIATGDVLILVHQDDDYQFEFVWEPAQVIGEKPAPGEEEGTMFLLRYNKDFRSNSIELDYAAEVLRAVASVELSEHDFDEENLELNEEQGMRVIDELWR